MYTVYSENKEAQKSKNVSQTSYWADSLENIAVLLWQLAKHFFGLPYKNFRYRILNGSGPLKILFLLTLAIVPSYFIFFDQEVMRFVFVNYLDIKLPPWVIEYRGAIFIALFSHLYFLLVAFIKMPIENYYNKKFKQLGLVPKYKNDDIRYLTKLNLEDDQKRFILYNPGVEKKKYQDKCEEIEATFDIKVCDIDYGKSKKIINIDFRDKDFPKLISYDDFYSTFNPTPYEFGVGMCLNGKKIFSTLEDMVHLLVAGETSGGKSTFLRQMLYQLLSQKSPLRVYFVDLKGGIEADAFCEDQRVTVYSETNHLLTLLQTLIDEYERRIGLFKEKSVTNIRSFEEKTKKKLPRHLLIIDECAEIFLPASTSREEKSRLHSIKAKISRLTRLARSAGIHIVLCTQRPSKEAIDMQAKDNMVSRLCFRVNNSYVSQMVLDNGRATRIEKNAKGRAIWKASEGELEVQVPFLDETDAKHRVSKLKPNTDFLKEEEEQLKKSKAPKIRQKEKKNNEKDSEQQR